jgi:hypothetical protein
VIITRSRRLVIHPRQYESIEIAASVQFDINEFEEAQDDPAGFANDWLDDLLEGEMAEAAKVTVNDRSIISQYRYTETNTEGN